MSPKLPTEAMVEATADEPDFIEGLQGFASMCDSGAIDKHDGPMLARKFRDAAFVVSMLQKLRDELRIALTAALAVAPRDEKIIREAREAKAINEAFASGRASVNQDDAYNAGLEKAALYHDGEAERIRRICQPLTLKQIDAIGDHDEAATAIRALKRSAK